MVGEPGLQAVEESGKKYSAVDLDLCFVLQVFLFQMYLYNLSNDLLAFQSVVS